MKQIIVQNDLINHKDLQNEIIPKTTQHIKEQLEDFKNVTFSKKRFHHKQND